MNFDDDRAQVISLIAKRVYDDKFGSGRRRIHLTEEQRLSESLSIAEKHFVDLGDGAALLTFIVCCFDNAIPDQQACHHIIEAIDSCQPPKKKTAARYFEELAGKYRADCKAILSMHVSPLVRPDVPPPSSGSGDRYTYGYSFNAHGNSPRILKAASGSSAHWTSSELEKPYPDPETRFRGHESWSQNAIWIYSTVELATQACRAEMSWMFAKSLALFDERSKQVTTGKSWSCTRKA